MKIQHVRNATTLVTFGGKKFLVDPMLSDKESFEGFPGTARSEIRNPMVALPLSIDTIVDVDAVIVTHLHPDHWDEVAINCVPKSLPFFAQNEHDAEILQAQGFTNVSVLSDTSSFSSVSLIKTQGQHGSDRAYENPMMAEILGDAAGVVLQHPSEKTLYLVGDTIWRDSVERDYEKYEPGVVILNAGYAHALGFGPIIMGKEDVLKTHFALPDAQIVAVHLEAINHCLLSRDELREYVHANQIDAFVSVPADGESLNF